MLRQHWSIGDEGQTSRECLHIRPREGQYAALCALAPTPLSVLGSLIICVAPLVATASTGTETTQTEHASSETTQVHDAHRSPSQRWGEEFPDEDAPRNLTLGVSFSGGLVAAFYGKREVRSRSSAIGGTFITNLRAGKFIIPDLALLLETQLSVQWINVGDGVAAVDGMIGAGVLGYVEDDAYLTGTAGLALGQRADEDNPDGQSFAVGVGLSGAAGYEFFSANRWAIAAEVRFSTLIFPGSTLDVALLQWVLGIGLHYR